MSSIEPHILQCKDTIQYNQYILRYVDPTPFKLYPAISLNMTLDAVQNIKYIYYFNSSSCINYFYCNNVKSFNILKTFPHQNILKIEDDLTVNIGNGLKGKMIICERENNINNLQSMLNYNGSIKLINSMIIFTQIISAIAHCHSLGIVRNSFKIKDIAIKKNENSHYKIIIENLINTKFIEHNPMHPGKAWMTPFNNLNFKNDDNYTPEKFNNLSEYDGCAFDIYNVGKILFTMLTGKEPFPHNNIEELKQKVLNVDLVFPENKNIPPEVISLIRRMMSVNPDERPSAMDILNIHWIKIIFNRICTPLMFPFGPMSGVMQRIIRQPEIVKQNDSNESDDDESESDESESESGCECECESNESESESDESESDKVEENEPPAKMTALSCYFCNEKFTKISQMFSHIREYHENHT